MCVCQETVLPLLVSSNSSYNICGVGYGGGGEEVTVTNVLL
jgi:hypothetical protein